MISWMRHITDCCILQLKTKGIRRLSSCQSIASTYLWKTCLHRTRLSQYTSWEWWYRLYSTCEVFWSWPFRSFGWPSTIIRYFRLEETLASLNFGKGRCLWVWIQVGRSFSRGWALEVSRYVENHWSRLK